MNHAAVIVRRLLEDEDDVDASFDPKQLATELAAERDAGKIDAFNALTAHEFYHRKLKYGVRNGGPIRVRRMGRTKTWKTRPGEFRIPVKYGLRDSFYIDHTNAHEWSTIPLP